MDNELNNNLNELNSSELKILKDLVNVTEEIVDIYDKLYYLEINGMKNSDKYNDIIEKLKLALIEEDNIYEDIEGEFDLASKILNNLVTDYLQFEDYIYLDQNNLIYWILMDYDYPFDLQRFITKYFPDEEPIYDIYMRDDSLDPSLYVK